MRKWNGLNENDRVMYNNIEYLLIKLYIENDKKLCDLMSLDNKKELKGISIYECIRLKD